MGIKENILRYIDKGNKGFISLCDCGRILGHFIIWMLILIIPGFIGTIEDFSFSLDYFLICIVTSVIMYICVILWLIILCIIFLICKWIGKISYCELPININVSGKWKKFKQKTKICKIKVIKLK